MMNASPLPPGPMEIPGGSLKPERTPPNSERYGRTEDNDSFASTLKAVHDDSRAKRESSQAGTDKTHPGDDVAEKNDKRPRNKENDTSRGEASEQAMPPSDTPKKNPEAAENPLVSASEMNATAQTEGEGSTEGGHRGHAGITLRSGAQIKNAAQGSQNAVGKSPEAANTQKIKPGAETIGNETSETASKAANGPSKEARTPGMNGQTAQTVAAAQSDPPNPEGQPAKDAAGSRKPPAAVKVTGDAPSGNALRAEAPPPTGGGAARENDMSEMGRFAKHWQNRTAANSGENAQEADPQSAPPDHQAASRAPSSKAGAAVNPGTSSGEAVRDASFAKSTETAGQGADSIGPHHHAPSFATAAASGRAEAASPAPGASSAMPPATEQFHQDNFQQLVERAMITVRGGQSEARIALKPDHLGHVQMKVVTEHHMVHIKIMTESPVARDLIDAHAHHLKSELQQQGLTVEHIEVSVSTNGQGDANRGARQREAFLHQLASRDQSRQDDDIDPSPRRAGQLMSGRSRSNGIDYFA